MALPVPSPKGVICSPVHLRRDAGAGAAGRGARGARRGLEWRLCRPRARSVGAPRRTWPGAWHAEGRSASRTGLPGGDPLLGRAFLAPRVSPS